MKSSAAGRFFQRILKTLMLLGVISALLLGYFGLEKANAAEAEKTAVADLYATYAGEESTWDINLFDTVMAEFSESNELIAKARSLLGDDTNAALITEVYYLPANGEISTAIGRRILVHRLKRTYSEAELFAIYCGIMGYDLTDQTNLLSLIEEGGLTAATPENLAQIPFLQDILQYLNKEGLLSEEYVEKLNDQLP